MRGRYLHVIYCDDIRGEVGNKYSLMGIYTDSLFAAQFPVVLPQLCLYFTLVTDWDAPLKELEIRVLCDDEVLVSNKLPPEAVATMNSTLAAAPLPEVTFSDSKRSRVMRSTLFLRPFQAAKPCALRICVQTESEELRGDALLISQAPAEMLAIMPAFAAATPDDTAKTH